MEQPSEQTETERPDDAITIAAELGRLDPGERGRRFRALPGDLADESFRWLDASQQEELLEQIDPERGRRLVTVMEPDDRAQLVDQAPANMAAWILDVVEGLERRHTEALLKYPRESAGHIMSPKFLGLDLTMTIAQALEEVRRRGREVETVYVLPVLGDRGTLAGVLELRELLLADPGARVADVMDPEPRSVPVTEDQEVVVRLLMATDQPAVPVLEADGRVAGIITFDDAMDVLSLEEAEDLARTGAAEPLERPYFSASIFKLARSRVVWLLVLVIAATLTVQVLNAFEATLEQVVSLALFIPLLIGTGGNTGAQSATTLVRAMAVDQVRPRDILRVVAREAATGAVLGTMLGALSIVPVWAFFDLSLSVVIAASLLTICTLASVVGASMPLLARRIGVDPAVVSAPFVTTVVDATGLLVYFLIARAVMGL